MRPDIPVVPLREAAEIIGISTRAAESALRHAGIKSGYPRAAVEWLAANRPGRGARTDRRRPMIDFTMMDAPPEYRKAGIRAISQEAVAIAENAGRNPGHPHYVIDWHGDDPMTRVQLTTLPILDGTCAYGVEGLPVFTMRDWARLTYPSGAVVVRRPFGNVAGDPYLVLEKDVQAQVAPVRHYGER